MVLRPNWRAGEPYLLLADEFVRTPGQLVEQCFAAFRVGSVSAGDGATEHEGRTHGQFIEMLAHVGEFTPLAAPPRGDRRQLNFLAEQVPAKTGHEGQEGGAFDHATAQRVDDGDASGSRGFDETRHTEEGIAAEFKRIAKCVGDPAQNDIHPPQALQRLHENLAIAHGEVVAFHESEAKQAGNVGVLEVSLVTRAGSKQNDGRVFYPLGRKSPEVLAAQADSLGKRPGANRLDSLRQHAGNHRAVLEHEANSAGHLCPVGQHPPTSVGRAPKIDRVSMKIGAVGRFDGLAGAQVAGIGVKQRSGNEPVAHEALHAMQVVQNEIQQVRALDEAGFEPGPFIGGDDERKQIQTPRLIDGATVLHDEAGNAVFAQDAAAVLSARGEFVRA